MTPFWARKRTMDYWYTLHEDWIVGDFQLGYRHVSGDRSVSGEEFWNIVIREKHTELCVSDWVVLYSKTKFDDVCPALKEILAMDVADIKSLMIKVYVAGIQRELDEDLKRLCGSSPRGEIT